MRKVLLIGLVAVAGLIVLGVAVSSTSSPTYPAAPSDAGQAASSSEPAAGVAGTIGDGTYVVGTDIAAGTYVASVPADEFACVWQRLKNTSGDLSAVITSGVVASGGHATVTIKATDAAFMSSGCGTWTKR